MAAISTAMSNLVRLPAVASRRYTALSTSMPDNLIYLRMREQLDNGETTGLRYINQRDVRIEDWIRPRSPELIAVCSTG